mmetsp:Transcript_12473/g.25465  ORF Transcript_12473/g.25465 Transcript_12473/m.25465 type:complete len:273 (-) Transcript_12473:1743-2561(-)
MLKQVLLQLFLGLPLPIQVEEVLRSLPASCARKGVNPVLTLMLIVGLLPSVLLLELIQAYWFDSNSSLRVIQLPGASIPIAVHNQAGVELQEYLPSILVALPFQLHPVSDLDIVTVPNLLDSFLLFHPLLGPYPLLGNAPLVNLLQRELNLADLVIPTNIIVPAHNLQLCMIDEIHLYALRFPLRRLTTATASLRSRSLHAMIALRVRNELEVGIALSHEIRVVHVPTLLNNDLELNRDIKVKETLQLSRGLALLGLDWEHPFLDAIAVDGR